METTSPQGPFTLKKILRENWIGFLALYGKQIGWHMAYNVWKVILVKMAAVILVAASHKHPQTKGPFLAAKMGQKITQARFHASKKRRP